MARLAVLLAILAVAASAFASAAEADATAQNPTEQVAKRLRGNVGATSVLATRVETVEASSLDEQLGASSAWGRRRRRRRRRYNRRRRYIRRRRCGKGQHIDTHHQTCPSCGTGRYMGEGDHTHASCHACGSGHFQDGSGGHGCKACDYTCQAGKYRTFCGDSTGGSCAHCPKGQFKAANGTGGCSACPVGQFQAHAGHSSCSACPAGQWQDNTGSTGCKSCNYHCPAGHRHEGCGGTSNGLCTACAAGKAKAEAGSSGCSDCAPGTFAASAGALTCEACASGRYQTESQATACKSCQYHCPAGQHHQGCGANSGGACEHCPGGRFKAIAGVSQCDNCDAGKYYGATGATSCKLCEAGRFHDSVGATQCKACDYHCNAGSHKINCGIASPGTCTHCVPGQHKPLDGTVNCADCLPGRFQAAHGSTLCLGCAPGRWQDAVAATVCKACNFQCVRGEDNRRCGGAVEGRCEVCDPGSFKTCAPGNPTCSSMCVACSAGRFQRNPGADHCSHCEPGTFAAAEGQSRCTKCEYKSCEDGRYLHNCFGASKGKCALCSRGKFRTQGAVLPRCAGCPVGKFQPRSGAPACYTCPKGKTTVSQSDNTECLAHAGSQVFNYTTGKFEASGEVEDEKCDMKFCIDTCLPFKHCVEEDSRDAVCAAMPSACATSCNGCGKEEAGVADVGETPASSDDLAALAAMGMSGDAAAMAAMGGSEPSDADKAAMDAEDAANAAKAAAALQAAQAAIDAQDTPAEDAIALAAMGGGGGAGGGSSAFGADLPPSAMSADDQLALAAMGTHTTSHVVSVTDDSHFDLAALMNSGSGFDAAVDGDGSGGSSLPDFAAELHSLMDDDPRTFGHFDSSGDVGSGTCMGGYISDLDLYLDCEQMVGFVAIVNSDEANLNKLAKLAKIEKSHDMVGPGGNALLVANNSNLLNLQGLSQLNFVAGGLTIEDNPVLHDASGVGSNLHTVGINDNGESIVIRNNPSLVEAGEWDISSTDGSLSVEDNLVLSHLAGFSSYKKVGGSVVIRFNEMLSDISGLQNINSVGTDKNGNSLVIVQNPQLHDLQGLRGLQGLLDGAVHISNNAALRTLDGLSQVLGIGFDAQGVSLNITGNDQLESISGLSSVAGKLGGSVIVMKNPSLKVLSGLQQISELGADKNGGSLTVKMNDILTNMLGFEGLTAVDGAVQVAQNDMLQSLQGLNHLNVVRGKNAAGQSIVVENNKLLADVDALKGLSGKLKGSITVAHNKVLKTLEGFKGVNGVSGSNAFGNSVEVILNEQLESLVGLEGLHGHVDGAIVIDENAALKSLEGLENVASIDHANVEGDSVQIKNNAQLATVEALGELQSVFGSINVQGNGKLRDVVPLEEGLKHVHSVTVKDVMCVSKDDVQIFTDVATGGVDVQISKKSECERLYAGGDRTTVGSGVPAVCGDTSGGNGDTAWITWDNAGSTGLRADVDTSACKFLDVPNYVTSIYGDSAHWQLVGVNSIYQRSATGFSVYVFHPVLRGKFMQYFAQRYRWRLSWLADTGRSSGSTLPGDSGWQAAEGMKNVLYMDVSTTKSMYGKTPNYVTSLHGIPCAACANKVEHWKAQGAHSVYEPTRTGFRVFVVYPHAITPQAAEDNRWAISWVGSTDKAISGQSGNVWTKFEPPAHESELKALWIDVDTSAGHFSSTPSYVTSVSGNSHHWMVTGAASIYEPTRNSFRLFLDRAQSVSFAHKYNWRVNYVTAAGSRDCALSQWGPWEACSVSCGKGRAVRERIVFTQATGRGKCDDVLKQSKVCDSGPCPEACPTTAWSTFSPCSVKCGQGTQHRTRSLMLSDIQFACHSVRLHESRECDAGQCAQGCEVSAWGLWDKCSKTCGTGNQKRTRSITREADEGGIKCPALEESQQCNAGSCPVDCELSEWGSWGECTVSCGWGVESRTRQVTIAAKYGGKKCASGFSMRPCHPGHCPQNCQVSPWGGWSVCTKSCGRGQRRRTRIIKTHAAHKGYTCPSLFENSDCNTQACTNDCVASTWSSWSMCDITCGGVNQGTRTRTRSIVRPATGQGAACGALHDTTPCAAVLCPVDCQTTAWSAWSHCSAKCGAGTQWRMRMITQHSAHGGKECNDRFQQQKCDAGPCAQHCEVGAWGAWGHAGKAHTCSKACGGGVQSRKRDIIKKALHGGAICPTLDEVRQCNTQSCPVDCILYNWGQFTSCSRSCTSPGEAATRRRQRGVLRPAAHGGKACDTRDETQECNKGVPCPVDCQVSPWSLWTACDKSCGYGQKERTRHVVKEAEHGGMPCSKFPLRHTHSCNIGVFGGWHCPRNCKYSPWGAWSSCTTSCGEDAKQTRQRTLLRTSETKCNAPLSETRACTGQPAKCPQDCVWGAWTQWSTCDSSCGPGIQNRTRLVDIGASHGGRPCAPWGSSETRMCNSGNCPLHCDVTEWGSWTACSRTCGDYGRQHRRRQITQHSRFGGFECPALSESQECNTEVTCDVDCEVSLWASYTACSVQCGVGIVRYYRNIVRNRVAGGARCPALHKTAKCDAGPCPVHCSVSPWEQWSKCSKTCGGGSMSRARTVLRKDLHGGSICPSLMESRDCALNACPVHCEVTQWGGWTKCSKPCNMGVHHRNRHVTISPAHGGRGCPQLEDTGICNKAPCAIDCVMSDWDMWSPCSSSSKGCGMGTKKRMRYVLAHPHFGGEACPHNRETLQCDEGPCPVHCEVTAWGDWGLCHAVGDPTTRVTCGAAEKTRTRSVQTHAAHGGSVCPDLSHTTECYERPCPIDCVVSNWGTFDACSTTCGVGTFTRRRTVLRHSQHDGVACPTLTDTAACKVKECPVDCEVSLWSSWSACSSTCGPGDHKRSRHIVVAPAHGGLRCPTMLSQTGVCHHHDACPIHCVVTDWGSWSSCAKSCGRGDERRMRTIATTPMHGGFACPSLYDHRACNVHRCPVNCEVSEYGSWGLCSKTCGGGVQKKVRVIVVQPGWGGEGCPLLEESRACNARECPVDCRLTLWGPWSDCSKPCDHGTRTRTRRVATVEAYGGKQCAETRLQTETCHVKPCPVHCKVSPWSHWSACTKSCASGSKTRSRTVIQHADHGGYVCPELRQITWCNQDACPVDCEVSAWSSWNSFIGGGADVKRSRFVKKHNLAGGKACPELIQTRLWHELKTRHTCAPHDEFGEWSKCTKPCGHGMRYRERKHTLCSYSAVVKLHLNFRQGLPCNVHLCSKGEEQPALNVAVPSLASGRSVASTEGVAPNLEQLAVLPMLAPADANLVEELVGWSRA